VKYIDDLVLLANGEAVLQGMSDRLTEIGRCYGMATNAEKNQVMRISRQPSPVQIMIDQRQQGNVEYFNNLDSLVTNDARCRPDSKPRTAMARAAFIKGTLSPKHWP
jgi:hypothetical protein